MHDWIEIKLPNASASLSKDLDERRKLFNVDIHKAAAASVDDKRGNFISNNPKMVNLQLLFRPVCFRHPTEFPES